MKKITIKDIARAAGVSTATVSYIMNNVRTQSISPETREKVMKAAQQLNYVRSISARSLKSGKSELIGIVLPDTGPAPSWRRYKYEQAVHELGRRLNREGYHLVVLRVDPASPKLDAILEREMDGAFVFDVSEREFLRISRLYEMGIPVMAVDCTVAEPMFHKLLPDFAGGIAAAEQALEAPVEFVITDDYRDPALYERLRQASGLPEGRVHVYRGDEELRRFVRRLGDRAGVAVNEFVALSASAALTASAATSAVAASSAPGPRIAVLCTCGCPELVPAGMSVVRFDTECYRRAAELMLHYIRKPHEARPGPILERTALP